MFTDSLVISDMRLSDANTYFIILLALSYFSVQFKVEKLNRLLSLLQQLNMKKKVYLFL